MISCKRLESSRMRDLDVASTAGSGEERDVSSNVLVCLK